MQDNAEIAKAVMEVEQIPLLPKRELTNSSRISVPLTELAMGSAVFARLTGVFGGIAQTPDVSTEVLYRFTSRGYGGGPTALKDGSGYLSTVVQDGKGIVGQGAFVPAEGAGQLGTAMVPFDPMTLAIAIALAGINKKLDAIQATQEEIFEFIKEDKRAEIRGDAKMLVDTLNNFKFNSENSTWRSTRHQNLLDIKCRAQQHIEFYKVFVEKKIAKRGIINLDANIAKKSADLIDYLSQYQASLYLFGFTTFLDVVFAENFDAAYLESVKNKLETYDKEYRELYSNVYEQLNKASSSSVEGKFIGGIAHASNYLGGKLSEAPILKQGLVDEALHSAGSRLVNLNNNRQAKALECLGGCSESLVIPFIENVNLINSLRNDVTVYYLNEGILHCCLDAPLAS